MRLQPKPRSLTTCSQKETAVINQATCWLQINMVGCILLIEWEIPIVGKEKIYPQLKLKRYSILLATLSDYGPLARALLCHNGA